MPGALYRGVIALSPPRGLCSTSAFWLCAQKYLIQHPWLLLELPLGQVPCSTALMLCHIPAPFKWNLTGYTYVACLHTGAQWDQHSPRAALWALCSLRLPADGRRAAGVSGSVHTGRDGGRRKQPRCVTGDNDTCLLLALTQVG